MATFSLAKGSLGAFSLAKASTISPCTPTRLRVRCSSEDRELAGGNVLVQQLSDQLVYANGRIKDMGLQHLQQIAQLQAILDKNNSMIERLAGQWKGLLDEKDSMIERLAGQWKGLLDEKDSMIEDLKKSRADEKSRLLQDSKSRMRELRRNIALVEENKRYLHSQLLIAKNIITVRGLFEHMEEMLCPAYMRSRPRHERWEYILERNETLRNCLSTRVGWNHIKQVESILTMYGLMCDHLHEAKKVVPNGAKIDIYVEPLLKPQAEALFCIGEALQLKIELRHVENRFAFDSQEKSEMEDSAAEMRREGM